jgi:hypothetical protein
VQWFVFFLRDMHLITANRSHGYFPIFDQRSVPQARRRAVIGKVQWVATDPSTNLACRGFKLVWQGAPYRLWRSDTPSGIFASELAAPALTETPLPELKCPSG